MSMMSALLPSHGPLGWTRCSPPASFPSDRRPQPVCVCSVFVVVCAEMAAVIKQSLDLASTLQGLRSRVRRGWGKMKAHCAGLTALHHGLLPWQELCTYSLPAHQLFAHVWHMLCSYLTPPRPALPMCNICPAPCAHRSQTPRSTCWRRAPRPRWPRTGGAQRLRCLRCT